MEVTKVISIGKGYHKIRSDQKFEIDVFVDCFLDSYVGYNPILWDDKIKKYGWERITSEDFLNLGFVKGDLLVTFSKDREGDFFDWLGELNSEFINTKFNYIPCYLVGGYKSTKFHDESLYESILKRIQHSTQYVFLFPLVILFLGEDDRITGPEVEELDVLKVDDKRILERIIEFPQEFYTAGVNILNYFGKYLRENYNAEDVKVRIEQDGNLVRLIVEGEDGNRDIVEKALNNYELIITGKEQPEDTIKDQRLVLEMQSELNILKTRINMQEQLIRRETETNNKLLDILENGLKSNPQVNLEVNQNTHTTVTVTVNNEIQKSVDKLSELLSVINSDQNSINAISDLIDALESIKHESSPEMIKNSPAMSKFSQFIKNMGDDQSDLGKIIKGVKKGTDIAKKLAKKYNSIAQWCGLPQVPNFLI